MDQQVPVPLLLQAVLPYQQILFLQEILWDPAFLHFPSFQVGPVSQPLHLFQPYRPFQKDQAYPGILLVLDCQTNLFPQLDQMDLVVQFFRAYHPSLGHLLLQVALVHQRDLLDLGHQLVPYLQEFPLDQVFQEHPEDQALLSSHLVHYLQIFPLDQKLLLDHVFLGILLDLAIQGIQVFQYFQVCLLVQEVLSYPCLQLTPLYPVDHQDQAFLSLQVHQVLRLDPEVQLVP
jgi:hypothetical protein